MPSFSWPENRPAALSLSFDDARFSQLDAGVPLLNTLGVRATFYVWPPLLEKRADEWRLVAQTHEIGNHTLTHPCTGNFLWSRSHALEEYTLEKMEGELAGAGQAIREMIGIETRTFAYPCGQMFVGRGEGVRSYVPLVAKRFLAGRGYLNEPPNDPAFCDLAQLNASGFDRVSFDELCPALESCLNSGNWFILAGHDVGAEFRQGVRPDTIEAVCRFARDNNLWLDTVESVASYVAQNR